MATVSASSPAWSSSPDRIVPSSSTPLKTTAGIDSRNEKRAAASRLSPRNSPAVIVAPDRDTPGTRAIACAKPIATPSRVVMSSTLRVRLPTFSAASKSSPSTIRVVPIRYRSRAPVSIWSLKTSPKIPMGIVPSRMYQPRRASSDPRKEGSRKDRSHTDEIRARSVRK